ncbi:MAG: DedA family protein [Phycisphaerae bacterium]
MYDVLLGLLAGIDYEVLFRWMASATYPVLLGILIIASLGLPIPEDFPLIAAGMVLKLYPGEASWPGVLLVALCGIMSGDIILYSLGRRWGNDVINHKLVAWLLPPERFAVMKEKFHDHGTWMCFFGRFFMGIRAAMCLTAGATHFPFWRFLAADMAGATLSIPLFVVLGYAFATSLPTLQVYLRDVQVLALLAVAFAIGIVYLVYRVRRRRRKLAAAQLATQDAATRATPEPAPGPAPAPVAATAPVTMAAAPRPRVAHGAPNAKVTG